jgi:hypothetical protein
VCCPPNTFQGITEKREVRHSIVNATLIENLVISVGFSHTQIRNTLVCVQLMLGNAANYKQGMQFMRNVTLRSVRSTIATVEKQ